MELQTEKPDHTGPGGAPSRGALQPRAPLVTDAASMWHLAAGAGALDLNSPYAYLLVCEHFASTSVVADDPDGGGLAGFVAAYRFPDDLEVLFVWQIGVRTSRRGAGLGGELLKALLDRPGNRGVRWLEATITPSNSASERLFRSFARSTGSQCEVTGSYPADLFPGGEHEVEMRYRIGPLSQPTPVKRGR